MSMTRTGPLAGALAVALLSCALATPAQAHPHVWITYETTVVYEKGTFVGVRHKWSFDEFYTAMAIEGLDKNKDGVYDRDELAELAKVNIDGLKDFSFFTFPGPCRHGDQDRGSARLLARAQGWRAVSGLYAALRQPGAGGGQGLDDRGPRSDLFHRLRAGQDRSRQAQRGRARDAARRWSAPRGSNRAKAPASTASSPNSALSASASARPSWWNATAHDDVEGILAAPRAGGDPVARHGRACPADGAFEEPARRCRRRARRRPSPQAPCSAPRPGCWRSRRSSTASLPPPCAASRPQTRSAPRCCWRRSASPTACCMRQARVTARR